MLPALRLSLVGSAHPSTFLELRLCESKAQGSLGDPCVPGYVAHIILGDQWPLKEYARTPNKQAPFCFPRKQEAGLVFGR